MLLNDDSRMNPEPDDAVQSGSLDIAPMGSLVCLRVAAVAGVRRCLVPVDRGSVIATYRVFRVLSLSLSKIRYVSS